VQQGADAQSIPSRAIVKLKDSLVGFDDNGLGVPDPLLPVQNRLGILNNPRQSILANRLVALQNYIETTNTIKLESFVTAEWNLNDFDKISNYGNYRYRPNDSNVKYFTIPNSYDSSDIGNCYTDNLESTITYELFNI
jgi:hypothetical protein